MKLRNAWSRLSIRLSLVTALMAIVVGLAVGGIAVVVARHTLFDIAQQTMEIVRNERVHAVVDDLTTKENMLNTFSYQPGVVDAFRKFKAAYDGMDAAARAALVKTYVDDNPYPLGSRSALVDAGDKSAYTEAHKIYHPMFVRWTQINTIDGILMVDLDGNVIYAVGKQSDFGSNLLRGPLKDEISGDLFRRALAQVPPWEVVVSDLRPYTPVIDGPAMMMATALQDAAGNVIGVVMMQLNRAMLSEVANNVKDLGDTGEVFLVGPDLMNRSRTRFLQDGLLARKIESYSARRAVGGFTGVEESVDYRGNDVVSAYAPVDFLGVRWGLVAKINTSEVTAPLRSMILLILAGGLISVAALSLVGLGAARSISSPLDQAIRAMRALIAGNRNVDVKLNNDIFEIRSISEALETFKDNLSRSDALISDVRLKEAQITDLLDTSPVGTIFITATDDVLFVNEPGAAILGRAKNALIGGKFSFAAIAQPEFAWTSLATAARRDGFVKKSELPVRLAEKGEAIFSVSLRRTAYGGQDGLLVWFEDITAQRQADEELRKLSARFVAFLESTPDIFNIKDRDGRYQAASQSLAVLAGIPSWRGFLGKTTADFFPAEIAKMREEADVEVLHGGKLVVEREETFRLHGQERWQATKRVALRGPSGDIVGVLSLSRDITDRKAAETALREAKAAAEAATEAKGNFLASMSHEIRTPMNGITAMAELLTHTNLDDDQRHMLRTIQESGGALITILNDILDLSKIEAGKLDIEEVSMSLVDIVEGVASTLTPNARTKDIRIHTFVDPALPQAVRGDPVRLRQILFNLIGNGVKFADSNDVAVRAVPMPETKDGRSWVRFEIIDRGIGISEVNQSKLFQAFSQAEASTTRRFGGTGLGLAICRRLVDLMHGRIGVKSREGQGSTFWVELPFAPTEDIRTHEKPRDLHGLRVALVGAPEPRRSTLHIYLRHWGAEVSAVDDVSQLGAAVTSAKDDAGISSVILDFDFDDSRQTAAIAQIRDRLREHKLPMIVLQDHHQRSARIDKPDIVTVDANPVIRYRIVTAVAVAAGRASPQIRQFDALPQTAARKVPTVAEAQAAGELILLAEDNPTNQDVIRRQLNMLGYTCEMAPDGAEALAAWRSGKYALLLTDCHMPNMDGYELTGAVRDMERDSGGRAPIIAVTANALQGEAERCLAAGMDDYVSKPIAMQALRDILQKWMPAKRGDDANGGAEAATPAINGRAIKNVFGDDPATFKEILQEFLPISREIVEELVTAATGGDAKGVTRAAHKLKSAARTVGADRLADTCDALEAAGRSGDMATIAKLAPTVTPLMSAVEDYIHKL